MPFIPALDYSVGREGPVSEPIQAPPRIHLGTFWGCVFVSWEGVYFGKTIRSWSTTWLILGPVLSDLLKVTVM